MTEANDPFLERLSNLESGQISDVLDEAGIPNHALSSSLFALIPGQRFVGRAACLKGEAYVQGKAQKAALPADTMEQVTRSGTVLVIEAGSFQGGALLGGFVAYSLKQRGCAAIVTDGAIRDADEIREIGLQCIQRTITPVNGARRWRQTVAGETVSLPGQTSSHVRIADGDYIVGDGDGVVVIPAAVIGQIVEDSEELFRIEKKIGVELRSGGSRRDVFAANPRFAHIRPAI